MNERPREYGLSPVQALRRIDAILRDRRMTLAERVATVGVALRASRKNGTAYPGFRFLQDKYGLGGTAIAKAVSIPDGLAVGVHLEPSGHGPRGVQRFRVLPVPDDDSPDSSAPIAGALDKTASAPTAGALPDGQCAYSEPPALPVGGSSAPGEAVQCAQGGSITNRLTSARTNRERTAADAATDFLSLGAARSDDNGNNNGHGNGNDQNGNGAPEGKRNGDDAERVISYAFPGGCSEKQRAAVVNAVANAVRQGASYCQLAHAVISPKAREETPWERIEAAGQEAAHLLSQAHRVWPPFKGETFLDLLRHMPENWRPKPVVRREGEHEAAFLNRQNGAQELLHLAEQIDAWRQQATTWPDNGGVSATG